MRKVFEVELSSQGGSWAELTLPAEPYVLLDTLEKLRLNCRRLFGVSTSTFDGATYGLTEKYTVEEMRAHIEAWKKKGVK